MDPFLPHDDASEPDHTTSPTESFIRAAQLYGYRPHEDEPDQRPMPDETTVATALAGIFEALSSALVDTRLESDLEGLLWATVNLFHRAADRLQRDLDRNEDAQRVSQQEQDGSEVKSVELERLTAQGIALIDRRDVLEDMRDEACGLFEAHTGSSWRPRSGSKVNHGRLTSAVIDSRDFLAARRRAETQVLLPPGTKIAVSGGLDFNDHQLIWDVLDKALARHPDMVLVHGGSPTGTERIAACWAENRGITEIPFKPDWKRHNRAAPFRRNDEMLSIVPAGVIAFPGSGITDNLCDKARSLGIPVWRPREGSGA
ncbi:MAG: DUF2493 domain-containing protein [Bosea sp.]|jgi:hypothetical protein|uniref:DUF2493 domain-containing protein n=1 Tax=Hyphomicrobiales TaxID=356 RepID=UPI0008343ECA|nr:MULTISPECIES: DUF2493 domain-containing protein [Hyphomicrobiales]MCP4561763.1 DUF2493 domain-containing protein [Bosea sp. (in: a-proteobacteria)]MCP4736954.1 DUF2493 domain-containing protein [Bosea sp. (in: a-proteobacteria)]MDX3810075.1 DUF2493 domain-containing protein [Bosea sp. (in: a-proteobacteria)]